jgi:hypothetical protein
MLQPLQSEYVDRRFEGTKVCGSVCGKCGQACNGATRSHP